MSKEIKSLFNAQLNVDMLAKAALGPSIQNDNDRHRIWFIQDIYDPDKIKDEDPQKYIVPRVGDMVVDLEVGWYWVSHVDYENTLKSTLTPWKPKETAGEDDDDQFILGGPYYYNTGEYLLAVDYSQTPVTAKVDNRIYSADSSVRYAKIFLGNDISSNGKVISVMYNNSGDILGDSIPVELAAVRNYDSKTIKRPVGCQLSHWVENGERCTLVFYDDLNRFSPPAYRLMAQDTSFIIGNEVGKKYVKEIELISPFFTSKTDPDLLLIPINVKLSAVEFRGRVWMSDGSHTDLTVTGKKMALNGLDEYLPTIGGQNADFILEYFLSADEEVYLANPGEVRHKSRPYRVQTEPKKGAYSPKLYVYPVWKGASNGYQLVFWLYDLDREIGYEVTNKVRLNGASPIYNPLGYGSTQNMIYNITLKDVDPRFIEFTLVQKISISLFRAGTEAGTLWTIGYGTSNDPAYGVTLDAKWKYIDAGKSTVNLANGKATLDAWLSSMYYDTRPLVDTEVEIVAPKPTHFTLYVNDSLNWTFPVEQWNTDLAITNRLTEFDTLLVKWSRRVNENSQLQLGISGLTVRKA